MSISTRATKVSGGTHANEEFVNPDRTYPPSCVSSPVPLGLWQSDPNRKQTQVTLIGDPLAGNAAEESYLETVTITVFRVACTSGKSATLVEIDRPAGHSTTLYPTFPGVSVQQGSNNLNIRLADDPNTFFTTMYPVSPMQDSDVFTLENFYGGTVQFDYNQAFVLTVDNFNNADQARFTSFPMAAYNAAQYPDASQPLPISGYLSGPWYLPGHGGEGMLIQIYDDGNFSTRTLFATWFTFDKQGLPFWLVAELDHFPIGTTTLTDVPVQYITGGGFAGNFTPPVNGPAWGTMGFSFPDCNHVNFTYNGNADAVNGPTGSGTRQWSRLASINGIVCGP